VRLSHPGTVILVDNVVRNGGIADLSSADGNVDGVRRGLEAIAAEPRLRAGALQTVGVKGYDGFAIALVEPEA
jgi:predicted O-methyltransferase YrrM